ncbi:autotransporter outer membrane beta-barrel domain-containing protein [Sphingobium boeckii]|uniref:Autotransporter domain-containing protein n=1 Tax=Sphingobium boeckii TaxID=1082345 RepID=A0A7W9AJ26_9SPHN|nr:autotransporter domain-containing protein [Sphingobium boeckii]MBB5686594.1 hypothetical protein [Sphingobium boeckii]
MRNLLACTCLTPIALLALPLHAETVVSTARTTPIATATANNGAADTIRIAAAGSVATTTSGVAVTMNSNHNVTNEGTVQITGANDASAIQANAGTAGTIANSGKIIVDENYTPTDTDKDGDLDGPFAQGARRYGIRTLDGFTGNVINSGSIVIEGNDSAGIALGGPLAGSLNHSGTITVTGDNSVGIRAGAVSGDVKLNGGAIAVQGGNAVGVALQGDIGGALLIQSAITATGYRSTTAPADVSKLDADDLLQGGPALIVSGSVAGGILFDVPPKDASTTDKDEDKDGIEDAKEGSAAVVSYGAAPAVQIGAATGPVAIGAVAGTAAGGHGIVINGTIGGNGVYKDVQANGIVIGGLGGTVTVAGGMTVNGTVVAVSTGGNATAVRIGNGASVPIIKNAGTISAQGGSAAASLVSALSIDAGANVTSLSNSGKITAAAAVDGSAVAVIDRAGTVGLIENSGAISATSAKPGVDKAVAINVSANGNGVTVRQPAVAATAAAPAIVGDVLFGSGNDLFDIADGTVTGAARFGAGTNTLKLGGDAVYLGDVSFGGGNDAVALAGATKLTGTIDFGGGSDSLTLGGTSVFTGRLVNSTNLNANLTGGKLLVTGTGPVALNTLALSGGSGIGVNIAGDVNNFTQYLVGGAANFATGSKIIVSIDTVSNAVGDYLIVKSGSMAGGANLTSDAVALPFMFKSSVAANDAAGEVKLSIARKSSTELGLNRSQGAAYNAIFTAIGKDAAIEDSYLAIQDGGDFRSSLRQMLPDHAGGAFETVTQASRATARFLADPNAPFADQGHWGFWLQQVAWGTSKSLGDTAAYDITGWGASGGAEIKTDGLGNLGLSLAYLAGSDADGGTNNEVNTNQFELAAYWRGHWGGLNANARASAARIGFDGTRIFNGSAGGAEVERQADGEWDGTLFGASAGLSYEVRLGKRFSLRPTAAIDYYRLKEDGYAETGGGDAFNLIVDGRTSDELAATGTMVAGYDFGSLERDAGWMRAEIEGGRRQLIGGSLGWTTARFKDGADFTLLPEDRTNGWVGKLRVVGGTPGFSLGGEFSAEEQQGRAAVAFRVSLNVGL